MDVITTATSPEVGALGASVALLPVGSHEQHGDHLPLATDTIIASSIAAVLAERYRLLLLPPLTISCSHEHWAWPGTVSIRATTLATVIKDVAESLHASGIDRLVIVNGHGGNYVLSNVVQEATVAGPVMALYPGRDDWNRARVDAGLETTSHDDMHAGELETSLLLHLHPTLVRGSYADADYDAPHRPHLLTLGMQAYTASGVVGRPSAASPAKGRALLESLIASFRSSLRLLDPR
ncbi:creatininase family protein [Natronosporangium hydrolyticum]|uniref:Creatininase family protein n=1 Tax=Natronosporangium hydrolyticum TaxID=2811111 RepID=A0A895YDB2_9ACTN|nr:creatininase family protein [Natronosporangium hydrolyticum]QSB14162.1 creatininase family protein [Natronosporangium hydrolyticum]